MNYPMKDIVCLRLGNPLQHFQCESSGLIHLYVMNNKLHKVLKALTLSVLSTKWTKTLNCLFYLPTTKFHEPFMLSNCTSRWTFESNLNVQKLYSFRACLYKVKKESSTHMTRSLLLCYFTITGKSMKQNLHLKTIMVRQKHYWTN